MASIDKIYGNRKKWHELHNYLVNNKKEYLIYMYECPDSEKIGPISSFSEEADKWLLKNCKLEWVIERIKDQYNIE